MWIAIVEAYNKTIDVVFRVLDWKKARPKSNLESRRKELEELSRAAQLKGDLHEMQRIRGQIVEVDKELDAINNPTAHV